MKGKINSKKMIMTLKLEGKEEIVGLMQLLEIAKHSPICSISNTEPMDYWTFISKFFKLGLVKYNYGDVNDKEN